MTFPRHPRFRRAEKFAPMELTGRDADILSAVSSGICFASGSGFWPALSTVRASPEQLKFQLLASVLAFVLDIEGRVGGDVQTLTSYLNGERFARLQRIGQSAQFGDEIALGIDLLKVSVLPGCRFVHAMSG